jgi:hypothetical protein
MLRPIREASPRPPLKFSALAMTDESLRHVRADVIPALQCIRYDARISHWWNAHCRVWNLWKEHAAAYLLSRTVNYPDPDRWEDH